MTITYENDIWKLIRYDTDKWELIGSDTDDTQVNFILIYEGLKELREIMYEVNL